MEYLEKKERIHRNKKNQNNTLLIKTSFLVLREVNALLGLFNR